MMASVWSPLSSVSIGKMRVFQLVVDAVRSGEKGGDRAVFDYCDRLGRASAFRNDDDMIDEATLAEQGAQHKGELAFGVAFRREDLGLRDVEYLAPECLSISAAVIGQDLRACPADVNDGVRWDELKHDLDHGVLA